MCARQTVAGGKGGHHRGGECYRSSCCSLAAEDVLHARTPERIRPDAQGHVPAETALNLSGRKTKNGMQGAGTPGHVT